MVAARVGRTSTASTAQSTPRNLFGFKDGTANLKAEESSALAEHVWVGADDDQAWLAGGSYLVARRVSMHIETWDRQGLQPQEPIVGRTKGTGAPLSGGTEHTPVELTAQGSDGPLVPRDSHVAVVGPERNRGARMLRRGYNFVDGSNALGGLDAGLSVIAFVRDPRHPLHPAAEPDGRRRRDDGVPPVHLLGRLRRTPRSRPGGIPRPASLPLTRHERRVSVG
ncbi:MAG: Dyp-type peroxidase [Nocardioides sp.]